MYRRPTDEQWFQAKVVNLSESGVLFGPTMLEAGVPVEVILSPPMQIGSLALGKQVCVCRVVRKTGDGSVAAHFEDIRFLLES